MVEGSVISVCRVVMFGKGAIGCRSHETTRVPPAPPPCLLFGFSFCPRTWLQLPGAAQRSTAVWTWEKRSNSSSRCKSLYAERAR